MQTLPLIMFLLGVLLAPVAYAQGKPAPTSPPPESKPKSGEVKSTPGDPKPNTLSVSVFSIPGGNRLVADAMEAVSNQKYDVAVTKLIDARQVFNQLSNFYQDLTASFSGVDNQIADSHRQKALEAAQLRDKSTFQLAVVYRANNQPELAIPLLVQLIRSQQPTRELGQQAYQQLFELGFVDLAYPRQKAPQK